jgi:hypothetical protein
MIVSKDNPPPLDKMIPSAFSFERGLDPFHIDAMPPEISFSVHLNDGPRREGWLVLDAWENAIGFIPDGSEIP